MAQNIQVLVKSKDSGSESTITYRAFLELQGNLDLIGQIDEYGNLIPGSPNLQPQHRKGASENATAVKSPVNVAFTVPEGGLPNIPDNSTVFHVEQEDEPQTFGTKSTEDEQADEPEEADGASASEPVKERKKPGPKPKNKEV